jgi:hypothetical protein
VEVLISSIFFIPVSGRKIRIVLAGSSSNAYRKCIRLQITLLQVRILSLTHSHGQRKSLFLGFYYYFSFKTYVLCVILTFYFSNQERRDDML